MRIRGWVWIVIGAITYGVTLATGHPLVLRGTQIPWGLVVIAIGLIFLGIDIVKRKPKKQGEQGEE
jgi:hypothetical protein